MTELPPLTPLAQMAILRQFRTAYGILIVFFAGLSIVLVAWHWSLPKAYSTGFAFGRAAFLLLGAAILLNGLSFFVQHRYVQGMLQRPEIAAEFSVLGFALKFYGVNLAIAVVLSVLGFYPWLWLVFFFVHYPIAFWLLPYHLPMGLLLGWMIQRQLP